MSQIEATLIDRMGSDLTVVNAARVSFSKKSWWADVVDEELSKRDAKLIRYLANHKHISPFGHCFMSFHVKAPIFVARQLVKHKFLRWNEVSRRYVDDEPEFYAPEEWRGRAENIKQGSGDKCQNQRYSTVIRADADEAALEAYELLLAKGVAPEQARMVLPQNTMTEWYWSGSLDAFADMCNLRLDPHAQYESRIVAEQISEQAAKLYPHSWEALVGES